MWSWLLFNFFLCCCYHSGLCNERKIKCSINLNSRKKWCHLSCVCARVCSVFTSQYALNSINNIDLGWYKISSAPSRCYQYQISSCHTRYVLKYINVAVISRIKAHGFCCVQMEEPSTFKGEKNCRIALKCYHVACARSDFDCSQNGRTLTLQIIGPFFIMHVLVNTRTTQPSVFNSIPIRRKLNVCPTNWYTAFTFSNWINTSSQIFAMQAKCWVFSLCPTLSLSLSLCLSSLLFFHSVLVCMFGKYKQIFVVCAHKTGRINAKHRHHYHNLVFGIESLYLNRKPIEWSIWHNARVNMMLIQH